MPLASVDENGISPRVRIRVPPGSRVSPRARFPLARRADASSPAVDRSADKRQAEAQRIRTKHERGSGAWSPDTQTPRLPPDCGATNLATTGLTARPPQTDPVRPSIDRGDREAEKSDIPDLDKKKYLVPPTSPSVVCGVSAIKLSAEKAIFIFVNNVLPPTAALMSSIYDEHKDEDGFLYIAYSGENTFGFEAFEELSA